MNKFILINIASFCILALVGCEKKENHASEIIQNAIEAHGGNGYDTLDLRFQFRDRKYEIEKKGGSFTYKRIFSDSTGRRVMDVLNNDGFTRTIDNAIQSLPDKEEKAFSNALNSVVYFALIPYGLNDKAVIKKYVGETLINGVKYHEIQISFEEEGGGTDFEDVFLYWINADTYFVDYMAYSFHVNGGGLRFREAINRRKVGDIYLQDYINYKPYESDLPLDSIMIQFKNNKLEKLSEINLIE